MIRAIAAFPVLAIFLWPFLCASQPPPLAFFFVRGDVEVDGSIDLSDAIGILNYLFLAAPEPPCLEAADSNDDGAVDLADPIHLLYYMYMAGPAPGAPFPDCGTDPGGTGLGCALYSRCEYQSLVSAHSILSTIAGKGELAANNVNEWDPAYEGNPAVAAELSSPHMAMGDDRGNIYIADKDAHAIRKVTLDGNIHTVAGTNQAGDDGDAPGPATERRLNFPNGLWVRGDSTLYILDTFNGKVRKVDTDGILSTMFAVPGGILIGRGLWVSEDEKLVYFSSGQDLKKWTPDAGVTIVLSGFTDLGNIVVDPWGRLVVTDRGTGRVWRISPDGSAVPIAGNGGTTGGGDGSPALQTGLNEVRGVWFLPHGGYFLATHRGSQVWYVDTLGIIHLFLNGRRGFHGGDGEHFQTPGSKVSEVRAVTVDVFGNVIVTEHDAGYIRKVERVRTGGS